MKNVHILPTPKPSKLYLGENGNFVFGMLQNSIQSINDDFTNQNICITSDEVPKLDEWGINTKNNVVFKSKGFTSDEYDKKYCKKIILTTDQDLIKDGVQAIDDEFLEWFVKNTSCEEVGVINEQYTQNYHKDIWYNRHKIIIPKDEPKQELPQLGTKEFNDLASVYFGGKPKQETIEEAAENYAEKWNDLENQFKLSSCFIAGAKWQQERMLETMDAFAEDVMGGCNLRAKEWYEQFKNKIK